MVVIQRNHAWHIGSGDALIYLVSRAILVVRVIVVRFMGENHRGSETA